MTLEKSLISFCMSITLTVSIYLAQALQGFFDFPKDLFENLSVVQIVHSKHCNFITATLLW